MQNELTYEQAAQALNTSVFTIRKAVSYGNLHPIKHEGDKTKYLSISEIERCKGKSLLTRRKNVAPTASTATPANADETMSNERLALLIQFIQVLFSGITTEAGKVSGQLISAALGSSRFSESMREIENFAALMQTKQGLSPQDIGEYIQRMDKATSHDLHTDVEIPTEFKIRAATFLAEEAQRQQVLQPA